MDRVWKEVGVVFDEETPELVIDRPYGRVDRKTLKARLVRECREGGVRFCVAKATDLKHFEDKPSVTTIRDSSSASATVEALLVADATGFSRQFVQHDTKFDPGYQNTYGARFRVEVSDSPR